MGRRGTLGITFGSEKTGGTAARVRLTHSPSTRRAIPLSPSCPHTHTWVAHPGPFERQAVVKSAIGSRLRAHCLRVKRPLEPSAWAGACSL